MNTPAPALVRAARIALAAQQCDCIALIAADFAEVLAIGQAELAAHGRLEPFAVNTDPIVRLLVHRMHELAFPHEGIGANHLDRCNALFWCMEIINADEARRTAGHVAALQGAAGARLLGSGG